MLPKQSPQRLGELALLIKEGNFKHNVSVLKTGNGIFITARRNSIDHKKHSVNEYYPCEYCKGFYLKTLLWHHANNCKVRKINGDENESSEKEEGNFLRHSKTLLYCSVIDNVENEILQVLRRMQDGDEKNILMKDSLLKTFTAVQIKALGPENLQKKKDIHRVSQNARSLAKLVIQARTEKPLTSILNLLAPENFDLVVRCVSRMSLKSRSLPARMGNLLGHCIMAKIAYAIRIGNESLQKESKDFKTIFDSKWRFTVNAPAVKRQNVSRVLTAVEQRKVNMWKDRPLSDRSLNELPLADDPESSEDGMEDCLDQDAEPLSTEDSLLAEENDSNPDDEDITDQDLFGPDTEPSCSKSGVCRRSQKRKWDEGENQIFRKVFKEELQTKRMPPRIKLQKASDALPRRTIAQIRTRVNNMIRQKQIV